MQDKLTVLSALEAALPGVSWDQAAPSGEIDVVGSRGRERVLVATKSYRAARVAELTGGLSELSLVLRHALAGASGHPIAIAVVPKLSAATRDRVRLFMSRFAPDTGWGLIARDGGAVIICSSLGLDWGRRGERGSGRTGSLPRSARPFTDLNRWMLKIMLLADADPLHWSGPRCRAPSTVRELQLAAGVAYETARKFVKTFETLGFIRTLPRGIELVRVDELLNAWSHEERQGLRREVPVRWLLGRPRDLDQELRNRAGSANFAIAGWDACRRHGGLVRGHSYVPAMHIEDGHREFCDSWSLGTCDARDAHLLLLESPYAVSTLRGAVLLEGVPVVDVLQAGLDVVAEPDRGREQADHILDEMLGLSSHG